jgi:hypothetical protein
MGFFGPTGLAARPRQHRATAVGAIFDEFLTPVGLSRQRPLPRLTLTGFALELYQKL